VFPSSSTWRPSAAEGEKTYKTLLKACENFLRLTPPMAGIIRADSKVKESIRHQTPILIRSPNSDAAEDVERVARNLWKTLEETRRATLAVSDSEAIHFFVNPWIASSCLMTKDS
jgi:flagellar biosynthesis protein FlhG